MKDKQKSSTGFTLIEMLVVVLIIGILAGIALPQYQMAVTKAKVASILPLMRRWRDALQEYKLQHGSYTDEKGFTPDGDTLGVNWPSDWKKGQSSLNYGDKCGSYYNCYNDYWSECFAGEDAAGYVYCIHDTSDGEFQIIMYQPDDPDFENFRGKITCYADGDEAHKICKALGGKLSEEYEDKYILY